MTKGKFILGLLGLVVIAAPILAFSRAEDGIKSAMEAYGPGYLGASVILDEVSISPIAGEAKIVGLTIGNPAGFNSAHAFDLGEISVELAPTSIFTDHVRIREILVDRPNIIWELAGSRTNIQTLQSNIASAVGGMEETGTTGTVVSIDQFIIRGAQVSVVGLPMKQDATLILPEIRLTNLGTAENGISPVQVGQQLFDALAPAIVRELAGSQFDSLTSGVKESGKEAAKDLQKKAADAVKKKLGGLLGGSKKEED